MRSSIARCLAALLAMSACGEPPLPVGPVDGGARAGAPDAAASLDAVTGTDALSDASLDPSDGATSTVDATAVLVDSGFSPDAAGALDASAPADAAVVPDPAIHVAITGNDQAAGTELAPLRTIGEGVRRAQPGETVRVHAGTYPELVTMVRSGLPGQPITLAAVQGERVVIDGTGLGRNLGEPGLVIIVDLEHIVVRGLELTGLVGQSGNFPAGIWVYGTNRDIRIEDNVVHHIAAQDGGRDSGAHGIAVYGLDPTPSEDIVVTGNEVRDLLLGYSEAIVINGNVRRFQVTRNTVHDVDNIAIDAIGFEPDVCPSCSQADAIRDDVNRARDGFIAENLTYAMSTLTNPAYFGDRAAACYYVDGGADIIIERNVAHDCDIGVELASEHFGKSTRRVTVRSNFIFHNFVTGIITGGYDSGTGPGGGSAEECQIVNNTIYDSARTGWADTGLLLQNRNVRNVYRNNIVVASPGSFTMSSLGSGNSGNVFEGNIDFGGNVEGINRGAGSRSVDPQLMAPAQGDLHLSPTSPARNGGVALTAAVAGALDVDGDPRVNGTIDVGADEL